MSLLIFYLFAQIWHEHVEKWKSELIGVAHVKYDIPCEAYNVIRH